jgi:hypothetical protein
MKKRSLINKNDIGYLLVIGILTVVMFFEKCDRPSQVVPPVKVDTVVKYVEIHDTVPGKPRHIKGKTDTLWLDSLVYIPDTSYPKLLEQYKALGNKYFTTNIYRNEFKIGTYGKASVTDTIRSNQLIASGLVFDIKVPEKTVIIEKEAPAKRQVYIGFGAYGNQRNFVDGVYVGGIYKDRQDRLSGASVGYGNGQINFGLSSYWKIKF